MILIWRKDVPAFHVVAGNPAKVLRKIQTSMDASASDEGRCDRDERQRAEVPKTQV